MIDAVATRGGDGRFVLAASVVPCSSRYPGWWIPRKASFVVDSGATITLLSQNLVPPGFRFDGAATVKLADSATAAEVPTGTVHLTVGPTPQRVVTVRAAVLPRDGSNLLGLDVVRDLEMRSGRVRLGHLDAREPDPDDRLEHAVAGLERALEPFLDRLVRPPGCTCVSALTRGQR